MTRPFRLGINYWPAASAMAWWPAFDAAECSADFRRIAAAGFDSVRLFLTWEHFQPRAVRVDEQMIERLIWRRRRACRSCPPSSPGT